MRRRISPRRSILTGVVRVCPVLHILAINLHIISFLQKCAILNRHGITVHGINVPLGKGPRCLEQHLPPSKQRRMRGSPKAAGGRKIPPVVSMAVPQCRQGWRPPLPALLARKEPGRNPTEDLHLDVLQVYLFHSGRGLDAGPSLETEMWLRSSLTRHVCIETPHDESAQVS